MITDIAPEPCAAAEPALAPSPVPIAPRRATGSRCNSEFDAGKRGPLKEYCPICVRAIAEKLPGTGQGAGTNARVHTEG